MDFSEIAEQLKKEFPIRSGTRLNKEDGDVLEMWGNENQLLNDSGAFLGSAGEIIFKKMSMKNLEYIFVESAENIIIINRTDDFIAFNFDDKPDEIAFFDTYKKISGEQETAAGDVDDLMDAANAIAEEEAQEEDKLSEIERKLFTAKIVQINYLIEEFSVDNDSTKWIDTVNETVQEMPNISQALIIDNNVALKDAVPVEIGKDEIQTESKKIIDILCKMAVKEFGAKDAKQKVQNVILKLNKR